MKTLKDCTLKEIEDLCLKVRYEGLESDDPFLSAFIPDKYLDKYGEILK